MNDLTKELLKNKDEQYKIFHSKLVPDINHEIIGVRVPIIKKIAKNAIKTKIDTVHNFLNETHAFYDEIMLHAMLISYLNLDIFETFNLIDKFLPFIDNWAVCDSFVSSLKIFKKHPDLVLEKLINYLDSSHPFTVRFAIVSLLNYYLDNHFTAKIIPLVLNCKCKHFYVDMAIAWFLSVALVKQYDITIPYFQDKTLPIFIQNKSIQKAIESFRIDKVKKDYLKSLKIK